MSPSKPLVMPEKKNEILESQDPFSAYWHAKDVIGGRFPEAEFFIVKDPRTAYHYAAEVIQDRWPEAEPYIVKEPHWAFNYAKNVLKRRWPEAEHGIFKESRYWEIYLEFLTTIGLEMDIWEVEEDW